MDFGTLLHVAKKNSETGKTEGKYYSTKFAPPKKESKDKKLSENIQKFLQKREQEEKERQRQEREKLANLLSMRDEKSKNKIRKMLKVTKSANKSVLDDAINTEHTAITLEGPEQAGQDDYGYVSTEANAFYQKYIEKVRDVKEDKGFSPSRPQSLKDLSGTKERVKAAITREIEEKKVHGKHRSSTAAAGVAITTDTSGTSQGVRTSSSSKNLYDPDAERREEERKKREEDQKKAKARKPMPPPMDFQALLKLAEKKQHEPVEILVEEKKKEPERLLTSKEKRELEERQREREARERRKREREREIPSDRCRTADREERTKDVNSAGRADLNGRIPKLNPAKKSIATSSTVSKPGSSSLTAKSSAGVTGSLHSGSNGFKKPNAPLASTTAQTSKSSSLNSSISKVVPKPTAAPSAVKKAPLLKSSTSSSALSNNKTVPTATSKSSKNVQSGATREFPPRDLKTKARQFPPSDVQKTRQFPPSDVRREPVIKAGGNGKTQAGLKRRILDDDDDDEYDSELDDFIDDGDCEEDYSSHIKAIFGYDKSRYRDVEDEDDAAMESNFAQVQREEFISKKIGIKEDLEDMKMEAAEKKRKMMMKKRKL